MTLKDPIEGWAMPLGNKRFHYFRNGMSLCHRYNDFLAMPAEIEPSKPICCHECLKRMLLEP